MKQFLARIICLFIPSKKLRHRIREAASRKSGAIAELSYKLDKCIEEINYLKRMVKYSTDITRIPPANGHLKMLQSAEVAILARFAEVSQKHGLKFWLNFGTLIGYVRHNGFVPWDDDIDVCMIRQDYEKLPQILDEDFCKDGFYYQVGEITRLYYKDIHVWVDIYPMDTGDSEIPYTGKEYDKFVSKIESIQSATDFDYKKWLKHEKPVSQKYLDTCFRRRDTELVGKRHENGFLFYGVESCINCKVLFPNETIFPLKPVKFYGIDAYIPNNADLFLMLRYGDYMSYPDKFASDHGDERKENISPEMYSTFYELITKYYPKNKQDE